MPSKYFKKTGSKNKKSEIIAILPVLLGMTWEAELAAPVTQQHPKDTNEDLFFSWILEIEERNCQNATFVDRGLMDIRAPGTVNAPVAKALIRRRRPVGVSEAHCRKISNDWDMSDYHDDDDYIFHGQFDDYYDSRDDVFEDYQGPKNKVLVEDLDSGYDDVWEDDPYDYWDQFQNEVALMHTISLKGLKYAARKQLIQEYRNVH